MTAASLSGHIADFVCSTDSSNLPSDVVRQLRSALLDGIASILSGVPEPVSRHVVSLVALGDHSTPQATIIGFGERTSLSGAALANGTLAHACEYDDSSWTMWGHATAPVLPAALAAAEYRCLSGMQMLGAFAVGLEVEKGLGIGMQPGHYKLGWHPTGTLGVFGATAAAAKALGLAHDQVQAALGIAASTSASLRVNSGSMTKPLHVGFAARNGMEAALLAVAGVTSSPHALDGPSGFLDVYAPDHASIDRVAKAIVESMGKPFDVVSPGLSPKIYPCCSDIHAAIDGVLDLREEHGLSPDGIEKVKCGVSPLAVSNISRLEVRSALDARFSLHYCVAVALCDGTVNLTSFTDEAVRSPRVRKVMKLIEVNVDPELSDKTSETFSTPAIVQILTTDGRKLRKVVREMRGHPNRPVSYARLAQKFRECAEPVLGRDRSREALSMIDDIESVGKVSELIWRLVPDR